MVHAKVEKVWLPPPAEPEGRDGHPEDLPLSAVEELEAGPVQACVARRVDPGPLRAVALRQDRALQERRQG